VISNSEFATPSLSKTPLCSQKTPTDSQLREAGLSSSQFGKMTNTQKAKYFGSLAANERLNKSQNHPPPSPPPSHLIH
jgi:hypothetical protein